MGLGSSRRLLGVMVFVLAVLLKAHVESVGFCFGLLNAEGFSAKVFTVYPKSPMAFSYGVTGDAYGSDGFESLGMTSII